MARSADPNATKRQRVESTADDGILIRVITPQNANAVDNIRETDLLDDGARIPLSTTLRQLKERISKKLGVTIQLPSPAQTACTTNECNCVLANSIAKYGLWDMLRGRDPYDSTFPYERMDTSGECFICFNPLDEGCGNCARVKDCPLVRNAGCSHIFHRDCYIQHEGQNCPGGCSMGTRVPHLILY